MRAPSPANDAKARCIILGGERSNSLDYFKSLEEKRDVERRSH